MRITDLNKMSSAPSAGQLLAYTRKQVLFCPYEEIDEVLELLDIEEILELHLFDARLEYRAIATESSRYSRGVIEHIADFPFDGDSDAEMTVYREDCLLEEGGHLTVLSHIDFDENGMIIIDDYRLMMGGKQNG